MSLDFGGFTRSRFSADHMCPTEARGGREGTEYGKSRGCKTTKEAVEGRPPTCLRCKSDMHINLASSQEIPIIFRVLVYTASTCARSEAGASAERGEKHSINYG